MTSRSIAEASFRSIQVTLTLLYVYDLPTQDAGCALRPLSPLGQGYVNRLRCSLFVFGILAVGLLWPHETPQRPLGPRDLGRQLAGGLAPAAPVTPAGEPRFKLALAADERLVGRRLDLASLEKLRRPIRQRALSQPELLPRTVALAFATEGRVLDCELSLQIGENRSAPLPCAAVQDFQYVPFTFAEPLLPGIFEARIFSTSVAPGQEYRAVAAPGKTPGELWLLADSPARRMSAAEAMLALASDHPSRVAGFLLGLALMSLALALGTGRWQHYAVLLVGLIVAVCSLTWHFSGHDETAHLEMLHKAQGRSRSERQSFYESAATHLMDSNFYRLHVSEFVTRSKCPHRVLGGSCGRSPRPLWLYRWYALAFPETDDAATLANYGRCINAALLAATLLLIAAVAGLAAFCASVGGLALAGFTWAQLASVTNDFPQTLFGLLLGTLLGLLVVCEGRRARLTLLAVAVLAFPATVKIDRSWMSALLMAPVFACAWLGPRLPSTALAVSLPWLAAAATFVLAPLLPASILELLPKEVGPQLASWPTVAELQTAAQAGRVALKSLFGSFLWGHAYFPKWLNALWALAIAAAALLLIFGRILPEAKGRRAFLMSYSAALAVTTSAWLLVARFYTGRLLTMDHWAKPRFIAACWLALLLPVWVLTHQVSRHPRARRVVFQVTGGLSLLGVLLALPKIFWIDVF